MEENEKRGLTVRLSESSWTAFYNQNDKSSQNNQFFASNKLTGMEKNEKRGLTVRLSESSWGRFS